MICVVGRAIWNVWILLSNFGIRLHMFCFCGYIQLVRGDRGTLGHLSHICLLWFRKTCLYVWMVMLIISLYIGKNNCFQKWAICNSLLCDAFINLFFKCPIVPRLWGTMGQWPGYIGTIWQLFTAWPFQCQYYFSWRSHCYITFGNGMTLIRK